MKKRTMIRIGALLLAPVLLLLSLFACGRGKTTPAVSTYGRFGQPVVTFGTLPQELNAVVGGNLFISGTAFSDRVLTMRYSTEPDSYEVVFQTVEMRDLYGKTLAEYTVRPGTGYRVDTLTATSDGGFLFVLGFENYQISPGVTAGDNGFSSRAIKCDRAGDVVFDTEIDQTDGEALAFCLEKDGRYYLFGTCRKPEKRKEYGETDVSVSVLSESGEVVGRTVIGGSDFDTFYGAELAEDGILLQVLSQSTDGDFPDTDAGSGGSRQLEVKLNDDLAVTSFGVSARTYATRFNRIGEKDGQPIYRGDPLFDGFDAGSPYMYLDYGDYYVIVSRNLIDAIISGSGTSLSINVFETVYSGYDREGNPLFRAKGFFSPPDENPSGFFCNRFRSLGSCPVALPEGVVNDPASPGYFRSSSLSETAYRGLLSDFEADGFAVASYESGAFLLRDDCAVWIRYENGSFSAYWYRTGEGAPENGISVAEAKTKLCGETDPSPIELHPIDVTPRGFFERTGGQIFAVPVCTEKPSGISYSHILYFVRGETVCRFDFESVAAADVDGDGQEEIYLLSYGPTSGLFTFELTVIAGEEVGRRVYYASGGGAMSFAEISGELVIRNRVVLSDHRPYSFLYWIRPGEQGRQTEPTLTSLDPVFQNSGFESESP